MGAFQLIFIGGHVGIQYTTDIRRLCIISTINKS